VQAELREVVRLQEQSALTEASEALQRAKSKLGDRGPAWLYSLLEEAQRDQQLLERLEAIRLNRSAFIEGRRNHDAEVRFNNALAARDYDEAFGERGLCGSEDDPNVVAARLKASALRERFLAALDEWAVCCPDRIRQNYLLRIARQLDSDPWRDRVRDPAVWGNSAALTELAETASVAQQPISLLLALGERLQDLGGDGVRFLRRVHEVYPDDFWTNFTLAKALHTAGARGQGDAVEALDYYRKALALRPGTAAVLNNLGVVFYSKFWLTHHASLGPGAISFFRQALQLDPGFAPALNNLGLAFKAHGMWELAGSYYNDALRINPLLAPTHVNLGELQAGSGQLSEAIDHYRQALRIDPEFARAHSFLGLALSVQGRLDEALASYPPGVESLDELRGAAVREVLANYQQAERFDPGWMPAPNILRTSPQDEGRLEEAITHYRKAIRIEPALALAHGGLGQLLLVRRNFGEAADATRRSLDLLPQDDKSLRPNLESQLQCCRRLLALENRLPTVVQGTDKPAVGGCRELAELCFVKHHYATAARLYAEALASNPQWGEDLRAGHRFNAARAAALAGCGRRDDAARLREPEREELRKQARVYLHRDLSAWSKKVESGKLEVSIPARITLSKWRDDPDLAGIRDAAALERLPSAERQECRELWRELDALLARSGSQMRFLLRSYRLRR
jgi:serine/threonine-protein kinase